MEHTADPNLTVEQLQARMTELHQAREQLSIGEFAHQVTETAAAYADITISKQRGETVNRLHQDVVATLWQAHAQADDDTYPTTPREIPKSRYAKRATERLHLPIPMPIDSYLFGGRVFEDEMEVDIASDRHKELTALYDQINSASSNHQAAGTIKDALVVSQAATQTLEYIQDRLGRFTDLGQDTTFLPRRLKQPAVVTQYWQEFMMGGKDAKIMGIVPALSFLDKLETNNYRELITTAANQAQLDPGLLDQALDSFMHLRLAEHSPESRFNIRQPILEALLQLDGAAITAAYSKTVQKEPFVVPLTAAAILGLSTEEFAELQQTTHDQQQIVAIEADKAPTRDQKLLAINQLNQDEATAQAIFAAVEGRSYKDRGKNIIRIERFSDPQLRRRKLPEPRRNSDSYLIIIHRGGKTGTEPGGSIPIRPTQILHKIMTGEWLEHYE